MKKTERQALVAEVDSYYRQLFDKTLSVATLEDLFVELCFINPKSPKTYIKEMYMLPKKFFRNKVVFDIFLGHLENDVKSSKKFTSQRRFRAFLALIYLKDFESDRAVKLFCSKKAFKSIDANIQPLIIAGEVYLSGNFKETFKVADDTFMNSDNLVLTIHELSKLL